MSAAGARRVALGAYVTLVLIFLMLPVLVIVLAAFTATSYLTIPPKGLTLKWFVQVLADRDYVAALLYSLKLAFVTTVSALLIGTLAAYALVRRRVPGAAIVSGLLMAPLAFPGIVIGVALLQYYSMVGMRGSFLGLALAHLVLCVPYTLRAVIASLSGVDPDLENAACTLGAHRLEACLLYTSPSPRD